MGGEGYDCAPRPAEYDHSGDFVKDKFGLRCCQLDSFGRSTLCDGFCIYMSPLDLHSFRGVSGGLQHLVEIKAITVSTKKT